MRLEEKVTNLLLKNNITPDLKGFYYIRTAICMMVGYCSSKAGEMKQIYEDVADIYGVKVYQVERNIRYSISKTAKPMTNSQFLFILAEQLERRRN